jgi:predicted TIM-barrel fold metal-dependent hydrolase
MFEDKILYATDNVMKRQREFIASLGLSEITYKKIYGENACRIVNL